MMKNLFSFFGLLGLMLLVAMLFKHPSNHQNFKKGFQHLATAEIKNDILTVHNLRDFRYDSHGTVAAENYVEKSYKLNQLEKVWYGISHFGAMGLAHVFMSFEFSDGEYLVVSIEARLRQQDGSYNPLRGVFRKYTKSIVLATEQDVIGLRSHIRRGEKLYLYPLKLDDLQQQTLLLAFMRATNALAEKPEFYNTLVDNCMVGLLAETYQFRRWQNWLDYRIMLPGFSDEFALENHLLKWRGSIDKLREKALVDSRGFTITDVEYSRKIRGL